MDLKSKIRVVPDFPKPGISFKDITTLLKDREAYVYTIDSLVAFCKNKGAELIVGPEARGFVLGAPVAYALKVGFVPVRKPGKLPAETVSYEYGLEYGSDVLEIHKDAIQPGQKVVVVDDLLATGGTALAVVKLVEKLGGIVTGVAFVIELSYLNGRKTLEGYDVYSVITYDD
ncbi:adenine phosphoribosyltransferase [Caldicoprobacter guelmensis]|uniref:adenine phosphoribosyltransferase n=1 Tax=Caldicoprobacter guelmensis TaxID=1170224 RepID=UPI001958499E|nr:adenine phosphoribosyltransferase [Caldicoprobacter guelmensis]MBM7582299.1 adenine phosphoribosyltransferase [Caldicoprobacter guelmensis]